MLLLVPNEGPVGLVHHEEGSDEHGECHCDHLIVADPVEAPVEEKASALLQHFLPDLEEVEFPLMPVRCITLHHERVLSVCLWPLLHGKAVKVVEILAVGQGELEKFVLRVWAQHHKLGET